MRKEFETTLFICEDGRKNETLEALKRMNRLFSNALDEIEVACPDHRAVAIATTKLQEACFFVKKAIADGSHEGKASA